MKPVVSIGTQDFEFLRKNNYFLVDKTEFIKEWWENGDTVTLITRPRRFGKTLNLNMLKCFFSKQYTGRTINYLSDYMSRYYGEKVLIFLDEYDTPMQEAYVNGYWKELTTFIRSLFNSTFKTNPYLERAVLTGITSVGKESIFSDMNNLEIVTTTSDKYTAAFGFTKEEVFHALKLMGMESDMPRVKDWYDGFIFGGRTVIYNPWSITKFLDSGELGTYWVDTSSNKLISDLIQEGTPKIKMQIVCCRCNVF